MAPVDQRLDNGIQRINRHPVGISVNTNSNNAAHRFILIRRERVFAPLVFVRSLLFDLLGDELTLFFQVVPCRLNLPMTLLLESFRPHRSVLMSLIVAASILPVTGILPNL